MGTSVASVAENPKSIKQKLEMLRYELDQDRQSFMPHWKELNNFFKPRRGRFNSTDRNRGDRRTSQIIDSTATFAVRTAAAGMHSGVTSPARDWFRLTVPDPEKGELANVKDWLYDVSRRMHTVLLRSNIYNSFPSMYADLLVYGTSPMIIEEDEEDVIRTYVFPIGSYCIANNSKGQVRTFVREFSMTIDQIVEKFVVQPDGSYDWSVASDHVKQSYDKMQRNIWVEVVHIIQPNSKYDRWSWSPDAKKFASIYYEKGTDNKPYHNDDRFLQWTGYDDWPIMTGRWDMSGEDVYSTDCPGMTILGDVKQLQKGESKSLKAVDKMIDPPMVAPTSMMTSKTSILPGDVSYVDDREGGFRAAHEVKISIQDLEYKQDQVRQRINRGMYVDLFLMLQAMDQRRGQRDVTAREIDERHEEKLLALGPVLEQLNQDVYDPTITRVFNIMMRRGMLPPPPQELDGEPLRVEYMSMMWQAQKAIGLAGIDRFSNFFILIAERTKDPTILENINFDDLVEEYAERTGVPPSSIFSREEVAQKRNARMQQQQAMQDAETLRNAGQGAKALSETDVQKPSALKAIASIAGGQA